MNLLENIHFINLTTILKNYNEHIEGNLICDIRPDNYILLNNYAKILNIQLLVKNKKKIIEIGINACHSLLLMLLVNPDAEYLLFDINIHSYTEPTLNYIKNAFPNTKFTIIYGDSVQTIKEYINNNISELNTYDFCHIDGGHMEYVFNSDYENIKKLANKDSIIVFDDYDNPHIYNFLNNKLLKNEIIKYKQNNILDTDKHLIYNYI